VIRTAPVFGVIKHAVSGPRVAVILVFSLQANGDLDGSLIRHFPAKVRFVQFEDLDGAIDGTGLNDRRFQCARSPRATCRQEQSDQAYGKCRPNFCNSVREGIRILAYAKRQKKTQSFHALYCCGFRSELP
jgi:hypothetical protein